MSIFLIFAIICLIGAGFTSHLQHKKRKAVKSSAKAAEVEKFKRSIASRNLLEAFDNLPEDSRPFTRDELVTTLEALDFKHGLNAVNDHFSYRYSHYYDEVSFNWDCDYNYNYNYDDFDGKDEHTCHFTDYIELKDAIEEVSNALVRRETALKEAKHAAELAGRQASIDNVSILTSRLRDEAKVLNEVARELSV